MNETKELLGCLLAAELRSWNQQLWWSKSSKLLQVLVLVDFFRCLHSFLNAPPCHVAHTFFWQRCCHPIASHSMTHRDQYGMLQVHLHCSDSIQFAQNPVKLDFQPKLLVCKYSKPCFNVVHLFPWIVRVDVYHVWNTRVHRQPWLTIVYSIFIIDWIGARDNLQESPIFDRKIYGVRFRFSLEPIHWLIGNQCWTVGHQS